MINKQHENYKELIVRLARTDFKLRYHGSVLGYLWAIVKPLLLFTVLNFVFSSFLGTRASGIEYYSLELLTAILLFNFFSEGTVAGMTSLVSKSQLVTKIFIPRWSIPIASTLNALFSLSINLIVLAVFFGFYGKIPTIEGIGMFLIYIVLLYVIITFFALLASALYVRYRDISMIWDVLLPVIMYSAPIIYPLSLIPLNLQKFLLLNPIGFIIHFAKDALIYNRFASIAQFGMLVLGIIVFAFISIKIFKREEKTIAENI